MKYINATKAAKILDCSVKQVYNYINSGKLTKYIEKRTGYTKLDESEVKKLKGSIVRV